MTLLWIALGGALGAVTRYGVGQLVGFPYGTLVVNVVGSFLMGLVAVLLMSKGMDKFQPLIMTGMLGGFTTFSTFSLDVVKLVDAERFGAAGLYVVASVALSLIAIFVATLVAKGALS
ncbi:MAG: fluoride efflux transporter CrcB [Halocynthiibacter sp.]